MSAIPEAVPSFDLQATRDAYQQDKRTMIRGFWQPQHAATISRCLATETRYVNAYFADGANRQASDQDLSDLPPESRGELQRKIFSQAAQGVGFFYGRHEIDGKPEAGSPETLLRIADILNNAAMLEKIRKLTGFDDICCASAQATRYLPGNFLTRHNDIKEDEGRRVAYVLNFSARWHPDWGGLLQFYQYDGTPRDAWAPEFNSLTLFDVNHVHAVTYVTPFAAAPRLAITGWFRNQPLHR